MVCFVIKKKSASFNIPKTYNLKMLLSKQMCYAKADSYSNNAQ